jgi:hypothetical protein
MTTSPRPDDRDDILFAFNQACPAPTAEQIIEWCERYPQLADDIRDHAAINRDWAARQNRAEVPTDETMLARGFSRVLSLLFEADNASSAATSQTTQSFKQAADRCGMDVPNLANQMDIDRSVLAALFNGRMLAPAGKRLVAAVTQALKLPGTLFEELHRAALAAPRLGHAKSSGVPTLEPQTYEAIIQASTMSPERKRYWMEED